MAENNKGQDPQANTDKEQVGAFRRHERDPFKHLFKMGISMYGGNGIFGDESDDELLLSSFPTLEPTSRSTSASMEPQAAAAPPPTPPPLSSFSSSVSEESLIANYTPQTSYQPDQKRKDTVSSRDASSLPTVVPQTYYFNQDENNKPRSRPSWNQAGMTSPSPPHPLPQGPEMPATPGDCRASVRITNQDGEEVKFSRSGRKVPSAQAGTTATATSTSTLTPRRLVSNLRPEAAAYTPVPAKQAEEKHRMKKEELQGPTPSYVASRIPFLETCGVPGCGVYLTKEILGNSKAWIDAEPGGSLRGGGGGEVPWSDVDAVIKLFARTLQETFPAPRGGGGGGGGGGDDTFECVGGVEVRRDVRAWVLEVLAEVEAARRGGRAQRIMDEAIAC